MDRKEIEESSKAYCEKIAKLPVGPRYELLNHLVEDVGVKVHIRIQRKDEGVVESIDILDGKEPDHEDEIDQVRKERDDLRETLEMVEHEVAAVYLAITNGKFSKANTASVYILEEFEQRRKEWEADVETCDWSCGDDDWDTWHSECGQDWIFEEDGPNENDMKFCPFCGRKIVVTERMEK